MNPLPAVAGPGESQAAGLFPEKMGAVMSFSAAVFEVVGRSLAQNFKKNNLERSQKQCTIPSLYPQVQGRLSL